MKRDLVKIDLFKYLNSLDILGQIRKRGFDNVQEKPVTSKSKKVKSSARIVYYEITTIDSDSDTVLQALQNAKRPFKLFGASMDLCARTIHTLETDSDSGSSSVSSSPRSSHSLSIKSGGKPNTPPSSQDHDEDVDWRNAPVVAEGTNEPRSSTAAASSSNFTDEHGVEL